MTKQLSLALLLLALCCLVTATSEKKDQHSQHQSKTNVIVLTDDTFDEVTKKRDGEATPDWFIELSALLSLSLLSLGS